MPSIPAYVWHMALAVLLLGGIMIAARASRWRIRHLDDLGYVEGPDVESCVALVEDYLKTGRHMEAMVCAKKGIKAAPDDPRVHEMLARVFLAQGKRSRAEKVLQEVLAQHPGWREAATLLAEIST